MSRTLLTALFLVATQFTLADDRTGVATNVERAPQRAKSLRVAPAIDAPFKKGLAARVPSEFVDVPLQEVLEFLADAGDIPIRIDRRALEEEGIPLDHPVDRRTGDVSIETVLDRILPPLQLTWIVKNEAILVTSRTTAGASKNLQRVVYEVRPLLDALGSVMAARDVLKSERTYPPPRAKNCLFGCDEESTVGSDLVEAIVRTTGSPDSWEDQGGPGSVVVSDELFVVRASQSVQREVDALLTKLAVVVAGTPQATIARLLDTPADERARSKLDTKVTVDFIDLPLREAVDFLADVARVEIALDRIALEEEGVPVDEPITIVAKDVSLQSAISSVLEPLSLTAVVRHGAIVVTSTVISEEIEHLETVVCDVRPIVPPGSGDEVEIVDMFLRMIGRPGSWSDQGGSGDVVWLPGGLLVVRQQQSNTREIEGLLSELRAHLDERPPKRVPADGELLVLDYTLTAGDAAQVADLVKTFVSPETWQGDENVIRPVGRQIFVRTTYANHVKIDELLSKLNGLSSTFGGGSFGLDVITPD